MPLLHEILWPLYNTLQKSLCTAVIRIRKITGRLKIFEDRNKFLFWHHSNIVNSVCILPLLIFRNRILINSSEITFNWNKVYETTRIIFHQVLLHLQLYVSKHCIRMKNHCYVSYQHFVSQWFSDQFPINYNKQNDDTLWSWSIYKVLST